MTQLQSESKLIKTIAKNQGIKFLHRYNDKRKKDRRLAFKCFNSVMLFNVIKELEKNNIKGWNWHENETCYGPIFGITKHFPL